MATQQNPAGGSTDAQPTALLANPRGFCAGVDRAIQIVERALEIHGAPVYVLHEIVHNKHVLEGLREKGTVFVKSLDEVPEGSITVFSAHGVSDAVVDHAKGRGLHVIDATCPLVTKVHRQAIRYESQGREVILVGHPGHPEVEGTRGRIEGDVYVLSTPEEVAALEVRDPDQLAYVTQTTLSVDDTREVIEALKTRFPAIQGPDTKDICYATQNRQTAVKEMLPGVDVLLVVGSQNSSNSNRLAELGTRAGVPSYLIDHPNQVDASWLNGKTRVGVTAGASAPEDLVQLILDRLKGLGVADIHEADGQRETVVFQMPAELL
ncbi:MAG: 4-hydroxy-3-methylbut-2-enyl diphosphate reductase [Planctomycetota bacterium]